jgi:hypothetical protein
MESITRAFSLHAEWIQPKTMERRFELRTGNLLYATLQFTKLTGSLATATSSEGVWTFKRVGFFNPRVTIRKEGSETDIALYTPKWSGASGNLQLADGPAYQWRHANFWSTRMEWTSPSGTVLVAFHSGIENSRITDMFKIQAGVTLSTEARHLQELDLLVLFGWYLMILHHDDSTAAVAAT